MTPIHTPPLLSQLSSTLPPSSITATPRFPIIHRIMSIQKLHIQPSYSTLTSRFSISDEKLPSPLSPARTRLHKVHTYPPPAHPPLSPHYRPHYPTQCYYPGQNFVQKDGSLIKFIGLSDHIVWNSSGRRVYHRDYWAEFEILDDDNHRTFKVEATPDLKAQLQPLDWPWYKFWRRIPWPSFFCH